MLSFTYWVGELKPVKHWSNTSCRNSEEKLSWDLGDASRDFKKRKVYYQSIITNNALEWNRAKTRNWKKNTLLEKVSGEHCCKSKFVYFKCIHKLNNCSFYKCKMWKVQYNYIILFIKAAHCYCDHIEK